MIICISSDMLQVHKLLYRFILCKILMTVHLLQVNLPLMWNSARVCIKAVLVIGNNNNNNNNNKQLTYICKMELRFIRKQSFIQFLEQVIYIVHSLMINW